MLETLKEWIRLKGRGGDLNLSYEDILLVHEFLRDELQNIPYGVIRIHEKYGPYLTNAYLLQCIEKQMSITLSYWDK